MTKKVEPTTYHAALLNLQSGGAILVAKSRISGAGSSKEYGYADLSDCMTAILPRLTAAELVLRQWSEVSETHVKVMTQLASTGAMDEQDTISTHPADLGLDAYFGPIAELATPLPKGANAKALGSAITYLRRYGVLLATGAVVVDEDDDGDASPSAPRETRHRIEPKKTETPDHQGALRAALAQGETRHRIEPKKTEAPDHQGALRSALAQACKELHGGDIAATIKEFMAPHDIKKYTDADAIVASEIVDAIDDALSAMKSAE